MLILCTYPSSPTLARAISKIDRPDLNLVVADEAHRCAGQESASNKTVLDASAIPAALRIFFRATPTVYGTRDRGRLHSHSVRICSMDNPKLFGKVIHHLSFSDAIRNGLLCPYQVAVIRSATKTIADRRIVPPDGNRTLEAVSLATQVACARAMRNYGCSRVVAFRRSVKHSQQFTRQFPSALALLKSDDRPSGDVWAEHVDGKDMPFATRMAHLSRFQSSEPEEHRLLSNVRLITEGVDIREIDGVAFVDTPRGQAAITQAVGRAVRPADGKAVGTILLPLIVRSAESLNAALTRSEHRHVVDILAALRSHDPEIARSHDDLHFDAGTSLGPPPVGRFVIDAPLHFGEEFADAVAVVALTQALKVGTKRGIARTKRKRPSPAAPEPELPVAQPTHAEPFARGLEALTAYRSTQLLPNLNDSGFLRAWWPEAKCQWRTGALDAWKKKHIGDNLS